MINHAPSDDLAPLKAQAPYEGEATTGAEATYSSRDLFRDKTEIRIEHQVLYCHRMARFGGHRRPSQTCNGCQPQQPFPPCLHHCPTSFAWIRL